MNKWFKTCNKHFAVSTALLLIVLGGGFFAKAGYIHAKAELAQHLMASAWTEAKDSRQYQKPWGWADTHVLGKIQYLDSQYYVLEGESGRNLAFGPALMTNSSPLGEAGNTVIVGHRDTHFSQLGALKIGDQIRIQSLHGESVYEVAESAVIQYDDIGVLASTKDSILTLITCYPFDSLVANPKLRYVVRAVSKNTQSVQGSFAMVEP